MGWRIKNLRFLPRFRYVSPIHKNCENSSTFYYLKGGSTNTKQALMDANSKMFTVESGARPDISKV